ncbi:MAG: hypothetical protein ACM3L5_00505 [Candidatus Saccharibacteria bacterium]
MTRTFPNGGALKLGYRQSQKVFAVAMVAILAVASAAFIFLQPGSSRGVIFSLGTPDAERHALGFIDDDRLYVLDTSQEQDPYTGMPEQNISVMRMNGEILWSREVSVISSYMGPSKTLYYSEANYYYFPLNLTALYPNGTVKWIVPDAHARGMCEQDGVLYVAGDWGVKAISSNGTVLWENYAYGNNIMVSPNGTLIVYSFNVITGMNSTSGSRLWETVLPIDNLYSGKVIGNCYYGIRNNIWTNYSSAFQQVTRNVGGLYAYDLNGTLLWKYPEEDSLHEYGGLALGIDGALLLMGEGLAQTAYKVDDTLTSLNESGAVQWTYSELHLNGPAIDGDRVLVYNMTGLIALTKHGNVDWSLNIKYYDASGGGGTPFGFETGIVIGPRGEIALSDTHFFCTVSITTPSIDLAPLYFILMIAAFGATALLIQAKLRGRS